MEGRGDVVLLAWLADWDAALLEACGAGRCERMDEPSRVRGVDGRRAGVSLVQSGPGCPWRHRGRFRATPRSPLNQFERGGAGWPWLRARFPRPTPICRGPAETGFADRKGQGQPVWRTGHRSSHNLKSRKALHFVRRVRRRLRAHGRNAADPRTLGIQKAWRVLLVVNGHATAPAVPGPLLLRLLDAGGP